MSCGVTWIGDADRESLERKGKGRDIGYALAASSCEGAHSVEYAPSRPLMRSPLSRFQTPTDSSQSSRFFRVWSFPGSPQRTDHPAYFRLATFYFSQPFQPSTGAKLNSYPRIVNADYWCKRCSGKHHLRRMQLIEGTVLTKRGKATSRFSTVLCTRLAVARNQIHGLNQQSVLTKSKEITHVN